MMNKIDNINKNLGLGIKKNQYTYECTYAWVVLFYAIGMFSLALGGSGVVLGGVLLANLRLFREDIYLALFNISPNNPFWIKQATTTGEITLLLILDFLIIASFLILALEKHISTDTKDKINNLIEICLKPMEKFFSSVFTVLSWPVIQLFKLMNKGFNLTLNRFCKKINTENNN